MIIALRWVYRLAVLNKLKKERLNLCKLKLKFIE